jgi:hypothetical protein
MKRILIPIIIFLVSVLSSSNGFAQTVEDRIKILEDALKKQEETIKEQRQLIEELKAEMKQVTPPAQQTEAPPQAIQPPGQAATASTLDQVQQQVQQLDQKVEQVVEAQKKEFLSVFNPAIGFVGETVFSYRSQPQNKTGSDRVGGWDVNLRSAELNLAGGVDPYARGYAVINASADSATGEATASVEEAAIQTTSLPWNLTLKSGRFFGEFGRLAYIHDHELPFVNRPLVLDRYIGGESRTDGAQLNYLLPTSHYVSVTAGLGDGFGTPPPNAGNFRPFGGLSTWGRASTYFELTPDISFEPGVSWLWNPQSNDRGGALVQPDGSILTERERRLLDIDIALRYYPLRNNQFQSLTWGTELLYSDNKYDVTAADGSASNRYVGSGGLYTYLAYKFHRQWTAGFEFQWLQSAQNRHAQTFAYSPYITWVISHWNQLRLDYTYTANNAASGLKNDNAVYLQWVWIIGSHAHGWQER